MIQRPHGYASWPREKQDAWYAKHAGNGLDAQAPEIITRRASEITPETFSWLWKYWLARGKLHIIGGVPETGKTTIAHSYAAIISSGATWPDGTRAAAGNVLIWTSEDSPADTLIPRLIRMGADLGRIHFIEETIPPGAKSRPFNPATDMLALVEKAKAIGDVALLIIDPIVATVPMARNSHNNAETRNAMQPVVDFAKAAHIAVLGIGHLTKGTAGKDPLERLNGSLAFGALPRLVMGAAKNEAEGDDEPERIMVASSQTSDRAAAASATISTRHLCTSTPTSKQPASFGNMSLKEPRASCSAQPKAIKTARSQSWKRPSGSSRTFSPTPSARQRMSKTPSATPASHGPPRVGQRTKCTFTNSAKGTVHGGN